METFAWPFHVPSKKFPENSLNVQFGRGYQYASRPKGRPQITYQLAFPTMVWFTNPDESVDLTTRPEINMGALEAFYAEHQLFEKFLYPSLTDGLVRVRFAKPLEWKLKPAGLGTVEPFTVELLSQP